MDFNSSLPVRTENAGDVIIKVADATVTSQQLKIESDGSVNTNSKITDGTDTLAINNDGSINSVVSATNLDIRDLVFATDKVDVTGSDVTVSNTVTVQSTNLDIRDLTHVTDSIKVGDGTDFLAINSDGSINAVIQEDAGTERVNYDTTASVAAGASDNHDFVFTNQAKLYQVQASASGKLKAEVQIETGAATNVFNTVMVGFNSTANPNIDLIFTKYALVPAGARVRVIRTNRDNQAQDVYSTIIAIES